VSGLLALALTPWVATPLLALLAAFGILVITGTPLHKIPERIADLREIFGHAQPAEYEDDYKLETARIRLRRPG
jgi:DNA segregation ATPase FtsK/SpoIIIE, S-DNA-T family